MEHHAPNLPPCHQTKHCHRHGFTLIEISIVLVIIGLIAGGVLVGQTLIKQAALRADMSLLDEMDAQVNTFKLKYNCLPGDCRNQTTFFPQADWGTSNVPTLDNTGWWGGNGNGDGSIFNNSRIVGYEPGTLPYILYFAFGTEIKPWQGVDSATRFLFPPLNAITGNIVLMTPFDPSDSSKPVAKQNRYYLGTHSGAFCCEQMNMSMGYLPADAYQIDKKIDDGLPTTGKVQATRNAFGAVVNGLVTATPAANNACISNAAGNPYLTAEDEPYCILRVTPNF